MIEKWHLQQRHLKKARFLCHTTTTAIFLSVFDPSSGQETKRWKGNGIPNLVGNAAAQLFSVEGLCRCRGADTHVKYASLIVLPHAGILRLLTCWHDIQRTQHRFRWLKKAYCRPRVVAEACILLYTALANASTVVDSCEHVTRRLTGNHLTRTVSRFSCRHFCLLAWTNSVVAEA